LLEKYEIPLQRCVDPRLDKQYGLAFVSREVNTSGYSHTVTTVPGRVANCVINLVEPSHTINSTRQ